MLLEFKIKNYKSFYHETDLTMFAELAKKEKREGLINLEQGRKFVLPSMVIYGANASGKTTLISAINTLKSIIVNGTIKKQTSSSSIKELELVPFIHDIKKQLEPFMFDITFKMNDVIYNYQLEIFATYIVEERKIKKEVLNVVRYAKSGSSVIESKNNIFIREENSIKISQENLKKYFEQDIENLEQIEKILNENIDKEALFLTTGFKSMISLKIESEIVKWFEDRLISVVDFSRKEPIVNFSAEMKEDNVIYGANMLDKLLQCADFGPQKIGYKKDDKTGKYALFSIYGELNDCLIVPAKAIESRGTIKLIDFWMGFMQNFHQGGVFVLDELDSSIHPELMGGIIDLFSNPEINKAGAQLIFNTHNPLFLQKKFFRRDQILFVEKNPETYMSEIYKLSEFNIRSDANYMKQYFEGNFGALPFIDFETAMKGER